MNDRLSFHLFTFGAGQSGLSFALCNLSFALCKGKWPNPLAAILWIHLLQLRYSLSNPAMEDDAAGRERRWHLDRGAPLNFYEGEARVRRRRQNKEGKRDPEIHQIKKGNQWYYRFAEGFAYGMKVHIGVDKETGLIHSVVITAANALDLSPRCRAVG
jgi:IS5 family transposase